MCWKQARLAGLLLLLSVAGGGCSSDSAPLILSHPTPGETGTTPPAVAETPPEATPSPLQAILTPADLVVGSPTEVYTRIARGVLTCWFGASGPLKSGYIYHADAQPASKGGQSEIKIMTRDREAEDPRALRAYRVLISPSGDKTKVEIENLRLADTMAARLKKDVERWSSTEDAGCGESPVTAGWGAEQVQAAQKAEKTKGAKKAKQPSP